MVWIKICGITRPEDATAAAAAGADALGFVFWPHSPRHVHPDLAGAIAASLPDEIARVGVFVDANGCEIAETAKRAGLSHIQLHGDEPPALAACLPLPHIRAFRRPPTEADLAAWGDAEAVLADGAAPGAYGGTGRPAERAVTAALAAHPRLILAGGLSPETVAARIAEVRPWGIDASSGLEDSPGVKNPLLVQRFMRAARAASSGRH